MSLFSSCPTGWSLPSSHAWTAHHLNRGRRNSLKVASYFQKVGQKVPWQKLAEDFEDETFRFQVLDEGEYTDRDWRDDLKKLLESTV